MTAFGFLPQILQPTRITEYSSTIIDNIYGNNFTDVSYGGNILIQFADHFSQFISVKKEINKIKPTAVYKRDYSNFDEGSFIDDVRIQNWSVRNTNDTNSKFNDFLWRTEGCIDRHAPLKKLNKKQLKKLAKPWINNYLLKMISHRERLLHKTREDPLNHYKKRIYNLFRNRITRETKKAKKQYYKQFFENNVNNMKKTWQGIKQIINLNNKSGQQITQLCVSGKEINTNKEMADTSLLMLDLNLIKKFLFVKNLEVPNFTLILESHIPF